MSLQTTNDCDWTDHSERGTAVQLNLQAFLKLQQTLVYMSIKNKNNLVIAGLNALCFTIIFFIQSSFSQALIALTLFSVVLASSCYHLNGSVRGKELSSETDFALFLCFIFIIALELTINGIINTKLCGVALFVLPHLILSYTMNDKWPLSSSREQVEIKGLDRLFILAGLAVALLGVYFVLTGEWGVIKNLVTLLDSIGI